MTRVVPVLGAILISLSLTGCPGSLDPSLAGGTGSGGSGGGSQTCDIAPAVMRGTCAINGCHDAMGTSAKFDMVSPGLAERLVGVMPPGGGNVPSACGDSTMPYLVPGSNPATGLFMDKIKNANPACGNRMPIGGMVNATDLDCFQRWANAAVMAAGSTGAGGSGGGSDAGATGQ